MNKRVLTVLLMVCITIIACVVCITVLNVNKVVENPLDGVVLEIKENTLTNTGLTLIIKNVAPNKYAWGSSYWVEKQINNNWEPVPDLGGNYGWTMEMRILQRSSITEEEIHWEWWLGELSSGDYRIVKTFAYLYPDQTNGDYYPISAEFTIN
jgi:hypothetical protein